MTRARPHPYRLRQWLVLAFLIAGLVLLGARAIYLQVISADYLKTQGNARHTRIVKDNSHRGMILDRSGVPLAISTPVDSVWAHPATLLGERRSHAALARLLDTTPAELARLLARNREREFVYLKRHVPPAVASRVAALQAPGVSLLREYRRYYPAGAVTGHVLGFTNVDDQGQEGIELAYDAWLRAIPGTKRVLKDLHGTAVEVVESVRLPTPGKDLVTSLDRRVQYLAYRELKAAVEEHGARAGAAVVLDAYTGEVLALVNEPDFNPNNRGTFKGAMFRNRAVTDLFEPGSTLKPFTVATALESGKFTPSTLVDTSPGTMLVGGKTIRDLHNYGVISVARVIEKSSNVGTGKIALALDKRMLWDTFRRVGFGAVTGSQLPGETAGLLNSPASWVPIDQVSMSYGYGISVTPLQLARAYAALANGGELVPVTLLRQDAEPPRPRVFSPRVATAVRQMLELAVDQGTGGAARVADYRVAGKTGTVHKLTGTGYADDDYVAWFAGFAPVRNPRLVMVVAIDGPRRGRHFGGDVAAPVFGHVMSGALRLLDIAPDAPRPPATRLVSARAGDR
ncbi:cell division protein [Sulfurifustis variabilis]|uniref:Peptidoglycan D,D-transpeptidase FtsI n=1 Tax=Sulfurifustis variabilis TaxID=1675686 RepID=A0A1B4V1A6_9GAMM|nr:penicillin-binding protein 2 [Sulfurifustis variabilis]BAU47268.1 cell division protein [Sulfurifustis variabilis]